MCPKSTDSTAKNGRHYETRSGTLLTALAAGYFRAPTERRVSAAHTDGAERAMNLMHEAGSPFLPAVQMRLIGKRH